MTIRRMEVIRQLRRSLVIAVLAGTLAGCSGEDGALSGSQAGAEQLAEAILAALAAEDRAALEALWITEEEYRTLLWDELPESKHLEFEFVWEMNYRNSREGLARALDQYGGQQFELVRIEFTDPAEVYETFTLHFGTELWVRRLSDGRQGELEILDVVLERQGRWKLMNYEE